MTDADLIYIRSFIGAGKDEDEIEEAFERLGSRDRVVLEITRTRLAELTEGPASWGVTGYHESNVQTIDLLEAQVKTFERITGDYAGGPGAGTGIGTVGLVREGRCGR